MFSSHQSHLTNAMYHVNLLHTPVIIFRASFEKNVSKWKHTCYIKHSLPLGYLLIKSQKANKPATHFQYLKGIFWISLKRQTNLLHTTSITFRVRISFEEVSKANKLATHNFHYLLGIFWKCPKRQSNLLYTTFTIFWVSYRNVSKTTNLLHTTFIIFRILIKVVSKGKQTCYTQPPLHLGFGYLLNKYQKANKPATYNFYYL